MKTVAVIGGGASGMMAALTAAEDKNNRVLLFERQQRVGRKLLSTGNGRCNLTNVNASAENYHGEQRDFVLPALNAFPPDKVLERFLKLGLVTVTEYGGRVYPLSNSANSVVDVLRFALEGSGVELRTAEPVRELLRRGEGFLIRTDGGDTPADYVIAACGGAAGAKLGGVTDGYELLKTLGHKRTALHPALVQLVTDNTYPRALKGVRAQARLRYICGGELSAESRGELQFTETGLSGPAAFDISRAVSLEPDGRVHIDFLGELTDEGFKELIRRRCSELPELGAEDVLTGVVHNRLGKMLVKYSGIGGGRRLRELGERDFSALLKACRDFVIAAKGVEGFDSAQVTAGGIRTAGVDPETMESRFVPHLFICGELLDVDADCGGFNLQWAWASGAIAGRLGK
ncbi:MAG: aminoacetone oxidase family FAD-binding enzyme [Oscillospiraceae bacterium]|nr:aminoacetone oxidase family FAD-binding enzyme [Oscillospiraceae bacterium]